MSSPKDSMSKAELRSASRTQAMPAGISAAARIAPPAPHLGPIIPAEPGTCEIARVRRSSSFTEPRS